MDAGTTPYAGLSGLRRRSYRRRASSAFVKEAGILQGLTTLMCASWRPCCAELELNASAAWPMLEPVKLIIGSYPADGTEVF